MVDAIRRRTDEVVESSVERDELVEEFVLGDTHPPHDPDYRYLFNSHYEAVGDRHPRHERSAV